MSKEDQPEAEEVLKHKFYVVKDSEGNYHVWGKTEYEKYINHAVRVGAGSAFKLVIGFNGDESYLFPAPQVNKAYPRKDFYKDFYYNWPGGEQKLFYQVSNWINKWFEKWGFDATESSKAGLVGESSGLPLSSKPAAEVNKAVEEIVRLKKSFQEIIDTGNGWGWGENFWAVKIASEAISINQKGE